MTDGGSERWQAARTVATSARGSGATSLRRELPVNDRRGKLPRSFYLRDDVLQVSRDLLGKVLCSRVQGAITRAVITETEAYAGVGDRASHAYGGRRTRRTEPMFADGGTAYVYLCYGLHHLFNVVTAPAGTPHAVLVRAAEPVDGLPLMLRRRRKRTADRTLLGGPGSLSQALGIKTRLTGADLLGDKVWIEDGGIAIDEQSVTVGPRIGIDYAGEDAHLPYRFILKRPH